MLAWSAPWLVLACAGKSTSNNDTGSGGSGAAGSGSAGLPGFSCPAAPPTPGEGCTPPDADPLGSVRIAHCSWGDDPRPQCRTTALCFRNQGSSYNQWRVLEPISPDCEQPVLPEACPETPATPGNECPDPTLQCFYADGTRCKCSPCVPGFEYPICYNPVDPPEWVCVTPAADCPNPPAQAGATCDQPGLECGLDCEYPMLCEDGIWQWPAHVCPICASADTLIATPNGQRSIASLRTGELVYSVDQGAISPVPILRIASTPVSNHRMVRMLLNDGAVIEMSPGHPTADGRPFSELMLGGELDEQHFVVAAEIISYGHDRTYDILPQSTTGTYFAAGALVGSTLTTVR
jgi:hypothetical protein